MTAADDGRTASYGVARPFESRVVRPEWATRAVAPMVDARGFAEPGVRTPVGPEAYQHSPTAYFVYRMRDGAGDHTGIVADVRLDAFALGRVRGHESVDPERVDGLVRYYADHPQRAEPVALLHDHPAELATQVARVCDSDPLLRFQGDDGVEHTVWRVPGNAERAISTAFGDGVYYIADGHHRVSARLRAWEVAGRPAHAGVLCVIFPMEGLTLSAFHRRVAGPVDAARLIEAASHRFDVRPSAGGASGIGVYVDGCWYDLHLTGDRPDGAAGLDASLVQEHLLGPVLDVSGQGHPRFEAIPDHLPVELATSRCDADGGALFVLAAPSLATLTRIADLGEVMPPKTTYFAPKPYAGIFLT
ncbi:DUF1015 family protein [Nocardioides sp.]|uniref:DUF1015 family protein n=1 Tax=Nocardioides sp. TaxID=35761 RepID=UPI002ED065E2